MPRERDAAFDDRLAVTARTIRSHRERLGLSQEDLAERAGLSAQMIYLLERTTPPGNPRLATLHALADALGVTARELVAIESRQDD